jgi:2'-5' RNA ligase/GNAT superfamily N-acetyltransferase
MPRQRLGVALLLPPDAAAEVDGLRTALGDGSLGRVPAHLTLVPPVNVREDDLPAALELLREAAGSVGPITLVLGPPATFLPENPVVYLAAGGERLDRLQMLRDAVFQPPLARDLTWPWVPHVTLADEADTPRIEAALVALSDYRVRVVFDRVHLLREERDTEGNRVWRPHADAVLAEPAVIGRGGLEVEITESEGLDPQARAFADAEWARYGEGRFPPDRRWREMPFALVARRSDAIVGIATGWTNRRVAHLSELLVAAGTRGEGVGSRLLAGFEHLARRRGASRLTLRTEKDGPASGFYLARGWREEVVFEDWIGDVPFVQMRRDL